MTRTVSFDPLLNVGIAANIPLLYFVKPFASSIGRVRSAGEIFSTVSSLYLKACEASIGAKLLQAGSTCQLDTLQRFFGTPFCHVVEKMVSRTPTSLPSLSITKP